MLAGLVLAWRPELVTDDGGGGAGEPVGYEGGTGGERRRPGRPRTSWAGSWTCGGPGELRWRAWHPGWVGTHLSLEEQIPARALSRWKFHFDAEPAPVGPEPCPPPGDGATDEGSFWVSWRRRAPIHTGWVHLWLVHHSSCERAFLTRAKKISQKCEFDMFG